MRVIAFKPVALAGLASGSSEAAMQRCDMARNRLNAAARQREVKWLGE